MISQIQKQYRTDGGFPTHEDIQERTPVRENTSQRHSSLKTLCFRQPHHHLPFLVTSHILLLAVFSQLDFAAATTAVTVPCNATAAEEVPIVVVEGSPGTAYVYNCSGHRAHRVVLRGSNSSSGSGSGVVSLTMASPFDGVTVGCGGHVTIVLIDGCAVDPQHPPYVDVVSAAAGGTNDTLQGVAVEVLTAIVLHSGAGWPLLSLRRVPEASLSLMVADGGSLNVSDVPGVVALDVDAWDSGSAAPMDRPLVLVSLAAGRCHLANSTVVAAINDALPTLRSFAVAVMVVNSSTLVMEGGSRLVVSGILDNATVSVSGGSTLTLGGDSTLLDAANGSRSMRWIVDRSNVSVGGGASMWRSVRGGGQLSDTSLILRASNVSLVGASCLLKLSVSSSNFSSTIQQAITNVSVVLHDVDLSVADRSALIESSAVDDISASPRFDHVQLHIVDATVQIQHRSSLLRRTVLSGSTQHLGEADAFVNLAVGLLRVNATLSNASSAVATTAGCIASASIDVAQSNVSVLGASSMCIVDGNGSFVGLSLACTNGTVLTLRGSSGWATVRGLGAMLSVTDILSGSVVRLVDASTYLVSRGGVSVSASALSATNIQHLSTFVSVEQRSQWIGIHGAGGGVENITLYHSGCDIHVSGTASYFLLVLNGSLTAIVQTQIMSIVHLASSSRWLGTLAGAFRSLTVHQTACVVLLVGASRFCSSGLGSFSHGIALMQTSSNVTLEGNSRWLSTDAGNMDGVRVEQTSCVVRLIGGSGFCFTANGSFTGLMLTQLSTNTTLALGGVYLATNNGSVCDIGVDQTSSAVQLVGRARFCLAGFGSVTGFTLTHASTNVTLEDESAWLVTNRGHIDTVRIEQTACEVHLRQGAVFMFSLMGWLTNITLTQKSSNVTLLGDSAWLAADSGRIDTVRIEQTACEVHLSGQSMFCSSNVGPLARVILTHTFVNVSIEGNSQWFSTRTGSFIDAMLTQTRTATTLRLGAMFCASGSGSFNVTTTHTSSNVTLESSSRWFGTNTGSHRDIKMEQTSCVVQLRGGSMFCGSDRGPMTGITVAQTLSNVTLEGGSWWVAILNGNVLINNTEISQTSCSVLLVGASAFCGTSMGSFAGVAVTQTACNVTLLDRSRWLVSIFGDVHQIIVGQTLCTFVMAGGSNFLLTIVGSFTGIAQTLRSSNLTLVGSWWLEAANSGNVRDIRVEHTSCTVQLQDQSSFCYTGDGSYSGITTTQALSHVTLDARSVWFYTDDGSFNNVRVAQTSCVIELSERSSFCVSGSGSFSNITMTQTSSNVTLNTSSRWVVTPMGSFIDVTFEQRVCVVALVAKSLWCFPAVGSLTRFTITQVSCNVSILSSSRWLGTNEGNFNGIALVQTSCDVRVAGESVFCFSALGSLINITISQTSNNVTVVNNSRWLATNDGRLKNVTMEQVSCEVQLTGGSRFIASGAGSISDFTVSQRASSVALADGSRWLSNNNGSFNAIVVEQNMCHVRLGGGSVFCFALLGAFTNISVAQRASNVTLADGSRWLSTSSGNFINVSILMRTTLRLVGGGAALCATSNGSMFDVVVAHTFGRLELVNNADLVRASSSATEGTATPALGGVLVKVSGVNVVLTDGASLLRHSDSGATLGPVAGYSTATVANVHITIELTSCSAAIVNGVLVHIDGAPAPLMVAVILVDSVVDIVSRDALVRASLRSGGGRGEVRLLLKNTLAALDGGSAMACSSVEAEGQKQSGAEVWDISIELEGGSIALRGDSVLLQLVPSTLHVALSVLSAVVNFSGATIALDEHSVVAPWLTTYPPSLPSSASRTVHLVLRSTVWHLPTHVATSTTTVPILPLPMRPSGWARGSVDLIDCRNKYQAANATVMLPLTSVMFTPYGLPVRSFSCTDEATASASTTSSSVPSSSLTTWQSTSRSLSMELPVDAFRSQRSLFGAWGTVVTGSIALGYATLGGPPGVGCAVMRSSTAKRLRDVCALRGSANQPDNKDEASPDNFMGFGHGELTGGVLSSLVVLLACVVAAVVATLWKASRRVDLMSRSTTTNPPSSRLQDSAASISLPGLLISGPHSLLSAPIFYNSVILLAVGGADNGGGGGVVLGVAGLIVSVLPLGLATHTLTFGFRALSRNVSHRRTTIDCLRAWPRAQRLARWLLRSEEEWVSHPAAFAGHYGALFDACRRGCHWYFLVEVALGMAASTLMAVAGSTPSSSCAYVGPLMCVVQVVALVALVAQRPYAAVWEQCSMVVLCACGAVASILAVVPGAEVAAENVELVLIVAAALFMVLTMANLTIKHRNRNVVDSMNSVGYDKTVAPVSGRSNSRRAPAPRRSVVPDAVPRRSDFRRAASQANRGVVTATSMEHLKILVEMICGEGLAAANV